MKTVKELSVELSIDRSTLLKAVQRNAIPGHKSGDIWLIDDGSDLFKQWVKSRKRKGETKA